MKILKNYKTFFENITPVDPELKINDTDAPDVKMSKEKLATLKEQLLEYKNKKPLIDNLFAKQTDPTVIESELTKILGKEAMKKGTSTGFDIEVHRNAFLIDYAHVVKVKYDIDKLQKENVTDKVSRDDFQQELIGVTDATTKASVTKKISDIDTRMADRVKQIQQSEIDFAKSTKEHNDRMKEIKDYLEKNIDKM